MEVAGAIADMVNQTVPAVYHDLDASAAQIHLLDYGDALLKPFSDSAHAYVAKVLEEKGVQIHLGTGVKEVATGHAVLSDATHDPDSLRGVGRRHQGRAHRGGRRSRPGPRQAASTSSPTSRWPATTACTSSATSPTSPTRTTAPFPSSARSRYRAASWAAKNILADLEGKPRKPFAYHDKGIMAMIGRGAAIAEVGKRHHEIHGELAHMAWLGVHASLMTGTKAKIEAFVDWAWDGFSKTGGPHVLDRGDAAQIDWDDDTLIAPAGAPATAG